MDAKKGHKGDTLFYVLSMVWPARCPGCGKITQSRTRLCKKCAEDNNEIEAACPGCGLPNGQCTCLKEALDLNLAAVYLYQGQIRQAIHAMKFQDRTDLFDFFSIKMADRFRAVFPEAAVDFVTAVPMTRRSIRQRGYNQSAELAGRVARQLGVKYEKKALEKTKETATQHTLSEKQRKKNMKGAFCVNPKTDLRGRTVLLCDDVKTTGATLNECRNALLKGGAKEAYCVTIAVTPDRNLAVPNSEAI